LEAEAVDEMAVSTSLVYRHPQHDRSEFQEGFQENILKINKNMSYACGDYDIICFNVMQTIRLHHTFLSLAPVDFA